jgi:hypothetical protein
LRLRNFPFDCTYQRHRRIEDAGGAVYRNLNFWFLSFKHLRFCLARLVSSFALVSLRAVPSAYIPIYKTCFCQNMCTITNIQRAHLKMKRGKPKGFKRTRYTGNREQEKEREGTSESCCRPGQEQFLLTKTRAKCGRCGTRCANGRR